MIIRILIIASGLSFVADASLAQNSSAEQVSDQNLDFFLIQAFNSKDARSRLALNHIGIQGQKQEALSGYERSGKLSSPSGRTKSRRHYHVN